MRGMAWSLFVLAACNNGGFVPRGDGGRDLSTPGDGRMTGFDLSQGDQGGPGKRVFVTSATMFGNFGGLQVGDDTCQSAAASRGLGGSFVAWLSDSIALINAGDRITNLPPWRRLDGTEVFSSLDDLVTSSLAPVDVDESGQVVPNALVWTGTTSGGESGADCSGWSNGTGNSATVGSGDAVSTAWSSDQVIDCGGSAHLYCFER